LCNMKTLYLRNVPADVIERLERLAKREKASVSAVAIRELSASTRRIDNPELLADLPDLNIGTEQLVADIDVERAGR
jgi:predicted CopG family antitoxin